MPPSLLPPTPEELEELRLRRRASQLKGYNEGIEDPIAQALFNVRRNLGEAGRAVVGAKPYDETNPTGSYRAVQALMNAPTPAAIIPEAAQAAGKAATALSGLGALGVVKPKGGNWLAGSIERALKPMKNEPIISGELIDAASGRELFKEYQQSYKKDPTVGLVEWTRKNHPEVYDDLLRPEEAAINTWLDTKLGKYIRNEMATPEDPVRALAERGITLQGVRPRDQRFADQIELKEKRSSQGFPEEGAATTEAGRNWEAAADRVIDSGLAGDLIRFEYANPVYGSRKDIAEKYLRENPWLEKLDPKTPVYDIKSAYNLLYEQTGFRHLIDELRNATDPDSGLPRSLQLSPEKLQKVTVPQAVELVDKINKWRAEQKVAADLKRSQNAATVEYKAYPQPNYFSAREPGSERFPGGFFTPDRAAAQKFGESFGKPVQGYVIEPRRTATEADVENVARRLGIYDEGVPADQYLTQGPEQIYDQAPQVVAELRNLGFDSARLNDGMSAQPSLVALDPSIVRPALDNPKGLRWVELKKPEGANPAYLGGGKYEDPAMQFLADALKYEGEVMGHCVGGYCPDVAEGRSRIYSLRDAKGEPHVTIEVEPGRLSGKTSLEDWAQTYEKTHGAGTSAEFLANHPEIAEAFVPTIKQIKGKANRAPKDEYLPFVQDFVRSGRWSSVGDLGNTGLIRIHPDSDLGMNLRAANVTAPEFVTQRQLSDLLDKYGRTDLPPYAQHGSPEDYAAGGAVRMKKGGAVTDPNEPEVKRLPEPGLLTATMYAETAAREMYPKDPVKRDAARHMIASSILGQKLSPGTSRLLGELYEFKTSPLLHLKSAVGLGAPPPGYEMDKFNNALGSELQFRNQAELQRGVRQAVDTGRARLTPDEPAPYRRGGAVKIETNPTLMADELLFKGYRR